MDSHQSTRKKRARSFYVNLQQDEGMLTRGKVQEKDKNKRRKEETDPLKIGSILEKILSFLDVPSIKDARQVDSLWSIEGAKMLINKCYIQIPSYLRVQNSKSAKKNNKMEQFKAFLSFKSSEVSMIPKITVEGALDVKLWTSLKVLGPRVTSLKYKITIHCQETAKVLNNLLDLLPNLKYLKYEVCTGSTFKVLTLVMSKGEKDQKPLVISSVEIQPDSYFDLLEDFEKFADCKNIRIEELRIVMHILPTTIPDLETRLANIINKLLLTSRNTLKTLILSNCEVYLSLLQFPCMTALTRLVLDISSDFPQYLCVYKFPASFRFSEKVPNLDEIVIKYLGQYQDTDFLVNLFENTGSSPSVKSVKYSAFLEFTIDPLLQNFPNIETFTASRCSSMMLHSFWKFGKSLKKLDIKIYLHFQHLADLDSDFTGFAINTIKRLKKYSKLPTYTCEELEGLRVNPSILDLKELEELKICFDGYTLLNMPKKILTIAGEYAFKQMPNNARVIITVNEFQDTPKRVLAALSEVANQLNVIIED